MAKNLGIELTDDQLNITLQDVNSLKKDPSLSLYAIPDGDVKGRVVAILLNDEVEWANLSGHSQGPEGQRRSCQTALLPNG
ncbi:hypothetical protein ACLB1T_29060 [Escherichia coli]